MNIPDIDPARIAWIDGPNGRFGITKYKSNRLKGPFSFDYYYKDARFEFVFDASVEPGVPTVSIYDVRELRVTPEDEAILRQNIEFFFKTQNFMAPKERSIIFHWRIAQ